MTAIEFRTWLMGSTIGFKNFSIPYIELRLVVSAVSLREMVVITLWSGDLDKISLFLLIVTISASICYYSSDNKQH